MTPGASVGHRHSDDPLGSGPPQRLGARGKRGSGGDHVVDHDGGSADVGRPGDEPGTVQTLEPAPPGL